MTDHSMHPAEPAGVSDEAVEAVARSMFEAVQELDWSYAEGPMRAEWLARAREALASALPHLQPQPVASRSQIEAVLHNERHFGRTCEASEPRGCLHYREAWRDVDVLLAAGVFRDEADVLCSCFVISDVNDNCPQHGRAS